jgi:hypothetical protein
MGIPSVQGKPDAEAEQSPGPDPLQPRTSFVQ